MSYNPNINQDYMGQDYRNTSSSNNTKPSNNMYNPNMQYTPTIPSSIQSPQQQQYPPQQYPPQQYQPLPSQYNSVSKSEQSMNQYTMPVQRQTFSPQHDSLYSNNMNDEYKPDKFNWIKFGKSIVIYTLLFLIMSHLKMNDFLCSFIPPLNNNEVICMVIKGIIMSLIIIVIQKILN
jgi:hypothetical protein